MERNDFSSGDSTLGQPGGSTAGSGFGNAGSTTGSQGYGGSATGGTPSTGTADTGTTGTADQGFAGRARDMAGTAQEKLADVGSSVRERAGTLKDSLADVLESGAEKLRQRPALTGTGGQTSQLAGATATGSVTVGDGRVAQVTDRVATGMDATAGWLRDADLEGLRTSIETQVKEHPGRTLLIAAGLGYLLGKALRK
jgi:hypothetical protein